jgi:hypothetical protein
LDGYVACSFVPLLNAHFDHVMLETSTNFALQVPLDALVYCNAYNSNQATSKQAIFTLTQGPTAAAVTEPGATQFIAAQALCELVPQPTITTVSAGTWIYPYVAGCQPQPAAVMLFFMSPGPPQAGQQKADRKRASRRQASRGGKRRARPTRPTRSAK